jgi:hypothetical protein
MTDRTSHDVRAGHAEPVRPASQRELVIQSLIRRPDDSTRRSTP